MIWCLAQVSLASNSFEIDESVEDVSRGSCIGQIHIQLASMISRLGGMRDAFQTGIIEPSFILKRDGSYGEVHSRELLISKCGSKLSMAAVRIRPLAKGMA